MAEQTQAPRPRDPTNESPVRRGAAGTAPTAPHATPGDASAKASGPERFWRSSWVKTALVVSFVASIAFHYVVGPWTMFPDRSLQFRDVEGDLAIPIDILEGDPEPPPPPPTPVPTAESKPGGEVKGFGLDASAARADAAARLDAAGADGAHDAAGAQDEGAIALSTLEAGTPDAGDAGLEDGSGSGALSDAAIASAEAGTGHGGPTDAVGMIGAVGNVQAGPQNVVLVVNMAVIRSHPVGARMGPLLSGIQQWDDFIAGTGVDPVRDTDWVMINGPSLINTDKDAILIHYSASDAVVDKAIDVVAHKYDRGGPFDAGVPGVKATLGHADRAQRVFLRPQPHLLAVVPVYYAHTAAVILASASSSRSPTKAGEAMRLKLVHPHGPMPDIPESVTELRLWIVPRGGGPTAQPGPPPDDGGADVYGEGDTADPAAASAAVAELRRVARGVNSLGVQLVTHGLLNGLELTPDGSHVLLHLSASRDQLEVVLAFVAGRLGVNLPPPPPLPPPQPSSAPPR